MSKKIRLFGARNFLEFERTWVERHVCLFWCTLTGFHHEIDSPNCMHLVLVHIPKSCDKMNDMVNKIIRKKLRN